MNMGDLNFWAILAAALVQFFIGGLWYSPALFHKAWMRENSFTDEDLKRGSPAVIFGLAFVFAVIMAANLAAFLAGEATDLVWGLTAGLLAGSGWVALGFAIIALFERRSLRYVLINGGYLVVSFTAMGAILGAWR